MTKRELIDFFKGQKEVSEKVDVDFVVALLNMLDEPEEEVESEN
jgi:hypothetical protein